MGLPQPTPLRIGAALALVAALALAGWVATRTGPANDTKAAANPIPASAAVCTLPDEPPSPHPGMVWVPGGTYTMGDSVYPEERPAGPSTVQGFWMDRTEVTNDQFAAFVQATGYVTVAERPVDASRHPPGTPRELLRPGAVVFSVPERIAPGADVNSWWRYVPGAQWRHPGGPGTGIEGRGAYPVVAVTLEDARAYARWKGHELPSEAQWEWAARAASAQPMPTHEQPAAANTWQGRFPMVDQARDGHAGLAPVGCYAPNALGLHDLIGNVWELTSDVFRPHGQEVVSSAGPRRGLSQWVIKGGSFLCSPDYCMRYRPGSRQPQDEDLGSSHVGFRTVLAAQPPEARP